MSLKEFYKLSKYKYFEIEVAKMWKLKTETIPVAIGTLGMINKGTLDSLLYKKCKILY